MSRVLFVHPFSLRDSRLEQEWATPYPPLGLLYLAAAVRRAGHEAALYDSTFKPSEDDLTQEISTFKPDAVCFSTLITWRPKINAIASIAKKAEARTLAGGPDASAHPELYLDWVDAVALGEGEHTLLEWLSDAQTSQIPGLITRLPDGSIQEGPQRPAIMQLDELPFPAYDLVDLEPYFEVWRENHGYTSLALAASRGCPFGCEHCAGSAAGPHFRLRSPDNVATEMRELEEHYHPDRFRLVDDLEGLGRQWLMALGQAMVEAGVQTPYEGLRPYQSLGDLPMLERGFDVCYDRNLWLPKDGDHPHAPPALKEEDMQARWRDGALPEGEHLSDP